MLGFLEICIGVLLVIIVGLLLTLAWQGGFTNPKIYREY